MLLKRLIRSYWYIGIIIYCLFFISNISDVNYATIHFVSFCSFILYGIVIYKSEMQSNLFFNKRNLIIIVLCISLLEVTLFQLLSYYIDGDTFVFSKADARRYFVDSVKMSNMSLVDGFNYITAIQGYGADDLGAFFGISTIFRIMPSQTFLSFCYCIIGTLSSLMVFDISRNFMPRKYAFMSAISFSLASFIVSYYAMCLKETMMLACIITSFNCFISFIRTTKKSFLFLTTLFVALVFFFRVPAALILIFSFGLTLVLLYMKGSVAMVLIAVLVLGIGSTSFFSYTYVRYMRGGNTEAIIERKNELAGGGGIVNQLADPVAALAGPFPSIKAKAIKATPLYASGLLYRFLLSIPFFMGGYFIFKKRYVRMYPLVLFFFANAIGIAISVKGLETRLSMPHLAMMYIVAFWFLAKHDYEQFSWKISPKYINLYLAVIFGLCVLWNMR